MLIDVGLNPFESTVRCSAFRRVSFRNTRRRRSSLIVFALFEDLFRFVQ